MDINHPHKQKPKYQPVFPGPIVLHFQKFLVIELEISSSNLMSEVRHALFMLISLKLSPIFQAYVSVGLEEKHIFVNILCFFYVAQNLAS